MFIFLNFETFRAEGGTQGLVYVGKQALGNDLLLLFLTVFLCVFLCTSGEVVREAREIRSLWSW